MTGRHDTVGAVRQSPRQRRLVQGARPLFFDYSRPAGCRLTSPSRSSCQRACRENGCALIGGETAEMPGFYADGEYDIAGFIVGIVDKSQIIDGRSIVEGDVLIGLPSAGLHTNGYSLARRVFFDVCGLQPDEVIAELGLSAGDALLAPHRSYLPLVTPLLNRNLVKGMAHITGGGITENLPRVLPAGRAAAVDRIAWRVPPIFRFIQTRGDIADEEMFRSFNMGIGLVVLCAAGDRKQVLKLLFDAGEPGAVVIGWLCG